MTVVPSVHTQSSTNQTSLTYTNILHQRIVLIQKLITGRLILPI